MSENINNFKNNQNISLLWEVLLDEFQITNQDTNMVSNMRSVFDSNINPFTNSMKHNISINLVNMNKQFLSQVIIAINNLFPNFQQIKQIQISDEEINQPYNVEDIRHAKQSDFEKQFNKKMYEFEEGIAIKKPKEVDFSIKYTDEKITEMDVLLKETLLARNFEINTIQNTYAVDTNPAIKSDIKSDIQSDIQSDIKSDIESKSVTWNDNANIILNIESSVEENLIPHNIFNKLKTRDINKDINKDINSDINNDNELRKLNTKIDSLHELLEKILFQQEQTNKLTKSNLN